jgi:predicted transcriptional regulator YdeE
MSMVVVERDAAGRIDGMRAKGNRQRRKQDIGEFWDQTGQRCTSGSTKSLIDKEKSSMGSKIAQHSFRFLLKGPGGDG